VVKGLAEDLASGVVDGIGEYAEGRDVDGLVRAGLPGASALMHGQCHHHEAAASAFHALSAVGHQIVSRLGTGRKGAAM